MSIVYFDTSALVKRYIAEIGSDWVKTLLENQAPTTVFTSLLTAKKAPVLLLAASVRECCRQRIITNS